MADTNAKNEKVELIIPEETQTKYPELVEGIKGSKSMDNKERNYWLQVLPVMTEEQVNELRDILSTEKKKLAEIEKKYASKGGSGGNSGAKKPEKTEEEIKKEEEKRQQEREERKQKEALARKEENVDDILSMLDDL